MPTPQGCTLCGGNDHARSECSWSGATDEREAATEAAYAAVVDGGWSSVKEMGVKMFQAGVAWQRAQSAPAGAVSDGWRLVPVEPTPGMLDVAVSHALMVKLGGDYTWSRYMGDVWARMLAAAPEPATVKQSLTAERDDEVRRLREALENGRRAIFAVLKQETKLKAVAKRVLAAEIERIDAALSAQGVGERT